MIKRQVLVTDTAPLYPPRWGGPRRIWNLYSNLSEALFEVTYVGMHSGSAWQYKYNTIRANFREILCGAPEHYFFWKPFKKVYSRDNSLDLFFYLRMHTDWHFKYALNFREYDIVICSHPWSSPCINNKNCKLFIYDAHNCEYLLMKQLLKNSFFKRNILKQVWRIEKDACRKSDIILVCSENEKNDFIDLYKCQPGKIVIIPNGADVVQANTLAGAGVVKKRGKRLIFLGAYYKPNIDAAKYIVEHLSRELKDFQFLIAGTVGDAFKGLQLPQNVSLLGFLPEKELIKALFSCDAAINPMFNGSGSNIKMLDYMACGLPIVATACGARGIETSGKAPMIICEADNFSGTIQRVINDSGLWEQMSKDGRDLVSQYYDWRSISKKVETIILEGIAAK